MTDSDEAYFKRKETIVFKDFETAFAGYQRLLTQVNTIRTWTVTVIAASLILALTKNVPHPPAIVGIALLALLAFLILELRERSSMSFNKNEVLNLECIFMERDVPKYNKSITDYVFRDLRLGDITRRQKLKHLAVSTKNWTVTIWYGFWLATLGVALLLTMF